MKRLAVPLLLLMAGLAMSCAVNRADPQDGLRRQLEADQARERSEPFVTREFKLPVTAGKSVRAASYGCYRPGQAPGLKGPSQAEILEDLRIIARHWDLIRVYNADDDTQRILEVIRGNRLPLKVLLGIWLENEEGRPAAKSSNLANLLRGIALANAYPELVAAVNVGNETQVYWSGHRLAADRLLNYVRTVRANTSVPVTTADDYNFWNKEQSLQLARELDFIVVHAYPLWNGKNLDSAIPWLDETLREVRKLHPGKLAVLGEIGWATDYNPARQGDGEQGTLVKGEVGLEAQEKFLFALEGWARQSGTICFWFEVFDEPWKGGGDNSPANEIEKNWGLYYANRSPKQSFTNYLNNHGN